MRRFGMISCKIVVFNCVGAAIELQKTTGRVSLLFQVILMVIAVGFWELNERIRDEKREEGTR